MLLDEVLGKSDLEADKTLCQHARHQEVPDLSQEAGGSQKTRQEGCPEASKGLQRFIRQEAVPRDRRLEEKSVGFSMLACFLQGHHIGNYQSQRFKQLRVYPLMYAARFAAAVPDMIAGKTPPDGLITDARKATASFLQCITMLDIGFQVHPV